MPPATERTESSNDTGEYYHFEDVVNRFYEPDPRSGVRVVYAAKTHTGLVRGHNEDHFLIVRRHRDREVIDTSLPLDQLPRPEQSAYVAAVADGMGGHAFGELASYLALRTGWDLGTDEVKWPVKTNDRESEELKRKATLLFRLNERTSGTGEVRGAP